MSASLVGSEMCIRDSGDAPPFSSGARSAGTWWRPVPGASEDAAQRPSAVSYTHLTLPTICSV
eukprot:12086348-Alexandrium_andersonii.AAC.1